MLLKNSVKIVAMLVVAVLFASCTSSDDIPESPLAGDASSSSSSNIVPFSSSSSRASSSSNIALPSSSSSLAGNVNCLLSIGCAEVPKEACTDLGGTVVTSCPASSSSSRPSSSSQPLSSSSNPNLDCSGNNYYTVPGCPGYVGSYSSSSSQPPSGGKGNNIANYRTVKIGDQTWMAENLDYAVEGSECYKNQDSYCNTYGRLYNWVTAMALPASCGSTSCASQISTKHKGICPVGWHIPSDAEWSALENSVGGSSVAAKHLKAKEGWNSCGPSGSGKSYSCEDTYGFAALPGGYGFSGGYFASVGGYGFWWSASEGSSTNAYSRYMHYNYEDAIWDSYDKDYLHSVRCAQD